jgi:formyltetrahydrofolate deformylase
MAAEEETPPFTARLLIDCADRPGIVAAVSGFLYEQGANIVSSNQYSSDPIGGRFYLRTEFFLECLSNAQQRAGFEQRFAEQVGDPFQMEWEVRYWGAPRRIAILVSRYDHCLVDLLWRRRRGELDAEIACVISNHPDLGDEVAGAGIPYHHVPMPAEGKARGEEQMLQLLAGHVELVVLARYMQILSGEFLERLRAPVINIHHSFLPAFPGADPYGRAREHGVKLIGATAHYVTAELDAGPIIDQDVARVDHRDSVRDLERIGRDIERIVLSRAVALHLDDRVIADAGRTIVF